MKRLTPSQRQALEDVERCGDPAARVSGMAQSGGWSGVMTVLQREKWIRYAGPGWELTEAGRKRLEEDRKR